MKIATILGILSIFASSLALSQTDRVPVQLRHSGDDQVGQRLAFELREVLRSANGMRLVTPSEADPRIVANLVTLDNSSANRGISTAASFALSLDSIEYPVNGFFLSSFVLTCGSNRVSDCARDIAANIDNQIEWLRREWPTLANELRQSKPRN